MEYTNWSSLATFRNVPTTAPPVPELILPAYDFFHRDIFVGGKHSLFWWYSSLGAQSYEVTVARNSNLSDKIDTYNTNIWVIFPDNNLHDLPADGSQIFWQVKARNEFGESVSQTASFFNDCNMASVGSGGSLPHIDTCSDDLTASGFSGYLLKDISRRGNGRMKTNAAIITGLNSENVKNGVEKQRGAQITPLQDSDNIWDAATMNVNDAIYAQAYTGRFYDYLLNTFKKRAGDPGNLNSFDGNGSPMYNLIKGVDCGSGTHNTVAYWLPTTWNVHYCKDGASYYPELVGHEWGHAVSATASTRNAGLDYYSESGALEEAFADWMGLAFKYAYFNNLWIINPWTFAPNSTFSANFADISQIPNYYNANGYIWNAGVQTNLRLPNTMFYLLAAGGEHPFSKIKVQEIGIATAMQIALRANMEEWKTNATFLASANGMHESVRKYFPQDPNTLYQVKNAWAAVGVGNLPQLTVTSSNSNMGTVSSSVKITTTGAQKQYEPVWGQNATVIAYPQPGYVFVNWTENGTVVPNAPQSYTFPAVSDRTFTANFSPIAAIDFGAVNVGQSSLPQTITISNYVQPVIYFTPPQLTGTGATDFSITANTCSSSGLAMNQSCSIQIAFNPHSVGIKEATLSVSATAGGQTVLTTSYPLTGSGVITNIALTSSSTTGGTVSLSGSQLWGGTATALATPNTGYAFTGWLEDGVPVSSAPSYSFTVNASRALLAMFSSTPPVITASPRSGNFGATTTGTAAPERTFTITNSGLQPLSISAISLSGVNRAEFGVTYNGCGGTLPPNSSCPILMKFTPVTPNTKTARLNITSNDPSTPTYVIDLSGYGGTPVLLYSGGFSADYYSSAQNAYNSASSGTEVRLWAADFNESLNCNRPVTTTIRGGYNGNFTDRIGKSALKGALTISSGTVVIDGLQIGGSSYQSTLSVAINTPGSGTVYNSPSGIICSGSCSSSFISGDSITLTATPAGDSVFTGWSGGGCSGTGSCSVTMTGDRTVTAMFSAAKISVAPSTASMGTVYTGTATSPQTITVTSSGTHNLIIGALSLSGANASEFSKPEDSCSGHTLAPGTTCTLQVAFAPASTGAKTVNLLIPSNDPQTTVFNVSLNGIGNLPSIFVSKAGNGAGTVSSSPAGISCGSSCTATYAINTAVTLTATPDFGYTFSGWSGACSGTGSCALTMNSDYAVTATFTETPIASCSSSPAQMNGSLYPSIQAAYNVAPDNSTIKLLATDIFENFTAGRSISVIIDGGYKCSFSTSSGTTVIHGDPFIANGVVNMMNISVTQ